jgi:hypothetical protein
MNDSRIREGRVLLCFAQVNLMAYAFAQKTAIIGEMT